MIPVTTKIDIKLPKNRAGSIRSTDGITSFLSCNYNPQQCPNRGKSRFDSGEGHVLCIEDTDDEPVSSMPINPKAPHSRSRSITPPPELAPEQKMKARNLVR